MNRGVEPHDAQARGVLAAPAAPGGRRSTTTRGTSPRSSGSGTAGTGARAGASSTGGAPSHPTPSSGRSRSTRRCRPSSPRWSGPKVYEQFVALVEERERLRTKGVALPHPAVRSRRTDADRPRAAATRWSDPGDLVVQGVVVRVRRRSAWSRGCGRTCPLRPGTTTRGRHRAQPRTRRTVPWTRSKTASGCALPRSADGVPFSRELLVTPGPHLRVPPPAARPYGPARPLRHCSGFGRGIGPDPGAGSGPLWVRPRGGDVGHAIRPGRAGPRHRRSDGNGRRSLTGTGEPLR